MNKLRLIALGSSLLASTVPYSVSMAEGTVIVPYNTIVAFPDCDTGCLDGEFTGSGFFNGVKVSDPGAGFSLSGSLTTDPGICMNQGGEEEVCVPTSTCSFIGYWSVEYSGDYHDHDSCENYTGNDSGDSGTFEGSCDDGVYPRSVKFHEGHICSQGNFLGQIWWQGTCSECGDHGGGPSQ